MPSGMCIVGGGGGQSPTVSFAVIGDNVSECNQTPVYGKGDPRCGAESSSMPRVAKEVHIVFFFFFSCCTIRRCMLTQLGRPANIRIC